MNKCKITVLKTTFDEELAKEYSGQLNMTEKQVAERLLTFFTHFSGIKWEGELYL